MVKRRAKPTARRPLRVRETPATRMFDGRERYRIVHELRAFLRAYGNGADGKAARMEFAARCGTSINYLNAVAYGYRKASMELAVTLDKQSHGQVPAEAVLPEGDWAYLEKRVLRSLRLPGTAALLHA